MGCVVNGPGEARGADIGISLPGSGETPAAPVYADGQRIEILKGDDLGPRFLQILEAYVWHRYAPGSSTNPPVPDLTGARS